MPKAKETRVKRVNAYPFALQIKTPSESFHGQVVKLTLQGFLAEIPFTKMQPGERFECTFEIPVLHHWVTQVGLIVKLYNQWGGSAPLGNESPSPAGGASDAAPAAPAGEALKAPKVVQLIEVHFQGLHDDHRTAINQFIRAIKQA